GSPGLSLSGSGGGGGGSLVLGGAGGSIDGSGSDLGSANAPVSPIVRMPAEEFSARALGGSLRAKPLEEAEAEEVWNRGSTALMREDTLSPSPSEILRQGGSSGPSSAAVTAAAAAAAAAGGGGSATAADGDDDDAAAADYDDVSGTASPSRPAAPAPAVGDREKKSGRDASPLGSDGSAAGSWREVRDKALAANGGSFTNSRRMAANAAGSQGSKVEFKRSALPTLGQLRRASQSVSPPPLMVGRSQRDVARSESDIDTGGGGGGEDDVGFDIGGGGSGGGSGGGTSKKVRADGTPEEVERRRADFKRREVAEKKAIAARAVAARDVATRRAKEAARAAEAAVSNAETLAAAIALAR
ncbi:unnamed protein product, partial [Scytosiphon promiscuus]